LKFPLDRLTAQSLSKGAMSMVERHNPNFEEVHDEIRISDFLKSEI
jgi:hypothetical protein